MTEFKNTMDVFKLLEKTNCRKCNKPTCLAFAASVFQGQIALSECPFIGEDILKKYGSKKLEYESSFEQDYIKVMSELKDQIKKIDLEPRAKDIGGKFLNSRLVLKILGKDFIIDENGEISTDIHVNPWIAPPVLKYVLSSKGVPLYGLESDLNLFFDNTADKNLPVENIYTLSTGLANMFKKLAQTHG